MSKSNQNQYSGLDREKPRVLPKGSSYLAIDTNLLYLYGANERPVPHTYNPTVVASAEKFITTGGASDDLVAGDGGLIPVSSLLTDGLDKIVICNQSNYTTTLGGVIDSTREYFIDGHIDMGTTQITVPIGGITLRGYSNSISGLQSAADNYTMFISETPEIGSGTVLGFDYHIEVSGTLSKVYEIYDATGFNAFEFKAVNYNNCTSLGDVHNYRQGLETTTGRFGGSPSLTLHGTWLGGYRATTTIIRSMSDTTTEPIFKAGTAFVMNSRFLTDMNADLGSLQPLLDFSPSNFPNSGSLELRDVLLTRDGITNAEDSNLTPNVLASDLCSAWSGNHGLHNTFVGGASDITVEVETIITTINVAETLLGTQVASDLQHFTAPLNGQLRFDGGAPIEYTVSWDFVIDGAANDVYRIEMIRSDEGVESVAFSQTRQIANFQGGRDVGYYSGSHHLHLHRTDFLYWKIVNISSVANATIEIGSDWTVDHR